MASFGQVALKDVWAMLGKRAPGHVVSETPHYYRVSFGAKVYPAFPKGAHGKANPPIQIGHVKKLARHLEIYDCAKAALSF